MKLTLPASDWIVPDWPAHPRVRAVVTSRNGGSSCGAFAGARGGGLNLRPGEGDDPLAVAANRALLRTLLPESPVWLCQVHGTHCVNAAAPSSSGAEPVADAAFCRQSNVVCAVQSADCMPVLFCDREASVVAAAHAGWRGLAAGVLDETVRAMAVRPDTLLAFLGPAIGQSAFEVGRDVRDAFLETTDEAAAAFRPHGPGKWLADLELLTRMRLNRLGVTAIYGGGRCTAEEPDHFFSYRRDGVTGRMASLIWLAATPSIEELRVDP